MFARFTDFRRSGALEKDCDRAGTVQRFRVGGFKGALNERCKFPLQTGWGIIRASLSETMAHVSAVPVLVEQRIIFFRKCLAASFRYVKVRLAFQVADDKSCEKVKSLLKDFVP